MKNYKITPQKQLDAILDYVIRCYAQHTINTNLLIDLLSEKNEVARDQLEKQVVLDLEKANEKIRDSVYAQYGTFDMNDFG